MPKQPVVTPKRTGRARLVSLETLKNEPGVTVSELVSRIKTPSQGSISRYLQGSNGTYKDVHKVFTEINMICFDKFDRIDHVYNVVNNSNVEEDAALSQCLVFCNFEELLMKRKSSSGKDIVSVVKDFGNIPDVDIHTSDIMNIVKGLPTCKVLVQTCFDEINRQYGGELKKDDYLIR